MADENDKTKQPPATTTAAAAGIDPDAGTDTASSAANKGVDESPGALQTAEGKDASVANTAEVAPPPASNPPAHSPPTSPKAKSPPSTKDDKDEATSRKRDREGSVEPSSTAAASAKHLKPRSSDALPAKKNRIIDTSDEEPSSAEKPSSKAAAASATAVDSSEKGKVGQIRRRVEELSYEERESKRADTGARRKSNESTSSLTEGKESDTVAPAPAEAAPNSPPTPARKQPTFSSFSSSSSPFASSSASAGVSGPSWLAGSSSSSGGSSPNVFSNGSVRSGGISGSTGAIRPSALGGGSGGGSDSQHDSQARSSSTSKSSATPTSAAPAAAKAPSGLGFGAFAGSRPFTKSSGTPQAANTPSPGTPASSGNGDAASDAGEASKATKESVFDKALKEDSRVGTPSSQVAEPGTPAEGAEQEETTQKVNIQKKADAELATGEEEERTVHSVRAKLYAIMKGEGETATSAADGQWKERGTGTVRVNVPRDRYYSRTESNGSPARLVMRAEGVLRLILNVALFSGMKVELAQDKFVRFVAVEEGALVHFALRVSNPAAAHALYQAIKTRIPAQKKTTTSDVGELA